MPGVRRRSGAGEEMIRVCPNPITWNDVFGRLTQYAQTHQCLPSSPPKPLVLAGWHFTNDVEKSRRWGETLTWAVTNECAHLVDVAGEDFYSVDVLSEKFIPE